MKEMKIKFESNLEYQTDAVNSICDIFEGEEIFQSNFSVPNAKNMQMELLESDSEGVGNTIKSLDENLLANIQKIQLRNGIPQSTQSDFKKNGMNFTVEMETGTGKTYVYLKTIFELNRRYGMTKFVIVVPSIAIKEGTQKSLDITKSHFKGEYDNIVYDYFVYNSSKLEQVHSFAVNTDIQIMVINIASFHKSLDSKDKTNIIHRYNDKLGCAPIELIQKTSPIVIIDEPQTVEGKKKSDADKVNQGYKAIKTLNPLCCLRYSATHRTPYNMMYKLDSIDAYNMKLVKQIEVASVKEVGFDNDAYISLLKVKNDKGAIKAHIEVDKQASNGKVSKKTVWVGQGDDLHDITNRDLYEGYIVRDIEYVGNSWRITFDSNDRVVTQGYSLGIEQTDRIKRQQIRMTIQSHLDKEKALRSRGVKVLSLFFIDKVSNYRLYDTEGNARKGKYARMFEEEYAKLINHSDYRDLFYSVEHKPDEIENIHNGYFSIDKTKKVITEGNYESFVESTGNKAIDEDTYNLIMKDKEKLLSFDSPLRFIFSHSALKEGWDNPNVFQICTLNESNAYIKKRQEIGRGLRLCVNQDGERVYGFDTNVLTVVANENYEQFAKALQSEIEEDEKIKFGMLKRHSFAHIEVGLENNVPVRLDEEKSSQLYDYLLNKGYINEEIIDKKTKEVAGRIQDSLKHDLKEDAVEVPAEFTPIKDSIIKVLQRASGNYMNLKNRDDACKVTLKKEFLLNEDFKVLWDKIKHKTTYSVKFDSGELILKCAEKISEIKVHRGLIVTEKAKLEISEGGVHRGDNDVVTGVSQLEESVSVLPDIVTYLQNETGLTRKTIVDILLKSENLDKFKMNPQSFIEQSIDIIRYELRKYLLKGIEYHRLDGDIWCQELFDNPDLKGYLNSNLLPSESNKSPYDYVIYDSKKERKMALEFERSNNVKLYAKLPAWFKIDTPIGPYNPDWVIVWEQGEEQKLYFVVETKGGLFEDKMRQSEMDKIAYGKKHFEALKTGVVLHETDNFEDIRAKIFSK